MKCSNISTMMKNNMQSGRIVVTVRSNSGSFFYIAREISRTLNVPLITMDKLEYFRILHYRPSFIINVGTLSPKKLIILSLLSKRTIAYTAVEGPFPAPTSFIKLVNNTNKLLLVAPSNYVKKELSLSGLKVFGVIPHGIDFNEVQCKYRNLIMRFHLGSSNFKLLTVVSSLQRRKLFGVYYLLRAWLKISQTVKRDSVVVLKVPTGSRNIFLNLAQSLGLKNDEYVIIDSHLTRDEILSIYCISNLYVHSTLSDGFGLPIIESLACGTPVVTMNSEPWNEIVCENVGWLVEVSKEVIIYEGNLPYRLKIPNINDFSEKLGEAIEYCRETQGLLRDKCMMYARNFDSHKVYSKFKELCN